MCLVQCKWKHSSLRQWHATRSAIKDAHTAYQVVVTQTDVWDRVGGRREINARCYGGVSVSYIDLNQWRKIYIAAKGCNHQTCFHQISVLYYTIHFALFISMKRMVELVLRLRIGTDAFIILRAKYVITEAGTGTWCILYLCMYAWKESLEWIHKMYVLMAAIGVDRHMHTSAVIERDRMVAMRSSYFQCRASLNRSTVVVTYALYRCIALACLERCAYMVWYGMVWYGMVTVQQSYQSNSIVYIVFSVVHCQTHCVEVFIDGVAPFPLKDILIIPYWPGLDQWTESSWARERMRARQLTRGRSAPVCWHALSSLCRWISYAECRWGTAWYGVLSFAIGSILICEE